MWLHEAWVKFAYFAHTIEYTLFNCNTQEIVQGIKL